jgi:SpoIIAA-like
MPATIQLEAKNIHVLRISGILKRSEFDGTQSTAARAIDAGAKPRVLAILENFAGWEKGADWNDLDFLFSHSQEIARIAIVGEPRWEAEALAFAGAGFRRAPVKFFPSDQEPEARAWLAQ